MKKFLAIALSTTVLAISPGLVPQASASDDRWFFGAGFKLGGFHFQIGFHQRDRYRGDYYFRTRNDLSYRGYSCSRACYRHEGHHYHSSSCPVVRHHAQRYGYEMDYLLGSYGPRGHGHYDRHDRGYYDRGYSDRGYSDGRDHRRYRDHRYDDRYDSRHRKHRAPRSCPY